MYSRYLKRLSDIALSSSALVVLAPVLVLSAILIKATSKGPVFFFQDRLGYKGKVFKLLKFRTMTHKVREVAKEVYKGDAEVTKVGAYLRRYKIDELPQLINVLLGDMSVVGPRPCLPSMKDEFTEDGAYRILVRPGLTGLAQVNGNIYLSWPERWKYDRCYVESLSPELDLKILIKTVKIVLLGEEKFLKKPI
jgi:lipopolysaccharide/colanic/teichoic acid biosynthesis glycosyltransferase